MTGSTWNDPFIGISDNNQITVGQYYEEANGVEQNKNTSFGMSSPEAYLRFRNDAATKTLYAEYSGISVAPGNWLLAMSLKWDTGAAMLWDGSKFVDQTVPAWTFKSTGHVQPALQFGFGSGTPAIASGKVGFDDFAIVKAPAITTHPASQTIHAGSSGTLSVVATGAGLTHQWRRNGVNIDGATSSSYTIPDFGPRSAGYYDVVVSNSSGTVDIGEDGALVTVLQPGDSTGKGFDGLDKFDDNARNHRLWGVRDFNCLRGRMTEVNGALRYSTDSTGPARQGGADQEDKAWRVWHGPRARGSAGPSTNFTAPTERYWAVEVEVNLPDLNWGDNGAGTVMLDVYNLDDPTDRTSVGLGASNGLRQLILDVDVNGTESVSLKTNTDLTHVLLRAEWDGYYHTITWKYDANGAGDGTDWKRSEPMT